jgi:WD40 repeat protein
MRQFQLADEGLDSIAVSPDGETLAVGHYERLALYRLADGQVIRKFRLKGYPSLWGLTFSPDGSELAGIDGDVWVWNLTTGRTKQLKFPQPPTTASVDVTYSPDGKTLVGCGQRLARWGGVAGGRHCRRGTSGRT